MLNSTVLQVAMGLVLVYLTLSLFCSAIEEWIARFLALRATALRQGINELLADGKDSGLAAAFHDHPLITVLKPDHAPVVRRYLPNTKRAEYPSYISGRTFALAILDLTTNVGAPRAAGAASVTVQANVNVPPTAVAMPVPDVISKVLADVNGDVAAMRQRLEQWFDDSMQRVSGWYKRRTQTVLFCIGALVAIGLNVDTLNIVNQLVREPTVREALVKQADAIVVASQGMPADSVQAHVRAGVDSIESAGVLFGWSDACAPQRRVAAWFGGPSRPAQCGSAWQSALGILITAIALALGAPFWFDALSNIANLRQSGAPPAQSTTR
jgi:hypothetical protein